MHEPATAPPPVRRRAGLIFLLVLGLLPGGCTQPAAPKKPQVPSTFCRFVEGTERPMSGTFETNLVSYRNDEGQEVTLAAAVHVGDGAYYQELTKHFETRDAVLFELIANPDHLKEPGAAGSGTSGVSMLQRLLRDVLELEFQLEAIDYRTENFVHADLDPETFARLQEERGESIFTFLWATMLREMSRQGGAKPDPSLQILAALFSRDRAGALKYIFAKELTGMMKGFDPEDGTESVILTDRNEKAIQVLARELKKHDKLCIFYGAAHMPDLERRLWDLGFEQQDERWLTAWDVSRE